MTGSPLVNVITLFGQFQYRASLMRYLGNTCGVFTYNLSTSVCFRDGTNEAFLVSLQIAAEFMRLVSLDLHQSFFNGLDKYSPTLLEFYRVRVSSNAMLYSLLQSLDVQVSIV